MRLRASSGLEWPGAVIGVSTKPGWTEFTRILSGADWIAGALGEKGTPPLGGGVGGGGWGAGWAAWAWLPTMPQIDEMLMIEPPPERCMAGTAALVPRNTPVALISMTRFQCSSLWSASRGPAVWPGWRVCFGLAPALPA